MVLRRWLSLVAILVLGALTAAANRAAAQAVNFTGTWVLDEKASKNVPDNMKGIDLKIIQKANRELATIRQLNGQAIGEPSIVVLDGIPRSRDVGGQPTMVEGRWIESGKAVEMIVTPKATGGAKIFHNFVLRLENGGKTMVRTQASNVAGEQTERRLVYQKKD